ncbi:MAG: hypothetical protein HYX75_17380 [Acidobacteria bacterium]|nr:hypothetical protein [Acidobacteriota bacterium]
MAARRSSTFPFSTTVKMIDEGSGNARDPRRSPRLSGTVDRRDLHVAEHAMFRQRRFQLLLVNG